MIIRVSNENEITRVIKVCDNGFKVEMFNLKDGEVAEIKVESTISLQGKKTKE